MEVNNLAILFGSLLILVVLIVRIIKLKRKFIDKVELLTSVGYILFAYISGVAIIQMAYLAILTYTDNLTIELIIQNKVYVFFAWLIIAMGAFISYISLLIEEKKKTKKRNISSE